MTLLVHCLYKMLPLNHKRTASSLAPPIFYVAKNSAIKRYSQNFLGTFVRFFVSLRCFYGEVFHRK